MCQIQGKIFELSIDKVECSSLIFIRRFMQSDLFTKFDDYSFLVMAFDINDCFYEIENEYGKIKYSKDEMFWIGYIKEVNTVDNLFQDAYVLGEVENLNHCNGKVYAIVERDKDKIIVVTDNKDYSLEKIKKKILNIKLLNKILTSPIAYIVMVIFFEILFNWYKRIWNV